MHAVKALEVAQWWQEKPEGKWLSVIFSPQLGNSVNMSLGPVVLRPGVVSDEHTHLPGVEEIFIILRGQGMLKIGDEEAPVEAGMVIFAEANKPHRLTNAGDEVLVALWIIAPAGEEKRIIDRWVPTDMTAITAGAATQ